MILAGFEFNSTTLVYILCVTLGILVLMIAYRQMLRYFGKGAPVKEKYCVLYELEKSPASGELEFYFTSEQEKEVTLNILNQDMDFFDEVATVQCGKGGNIVRYDSTKLANGNYFYCLQTSNQKTMKKMRVANS